MDIEGLGEALVDQLVDTGLVKDLADLYDLDFEAGRRPRADGRASPPRTSSGRSRPARRHPLHRLLFGLGIRFVGERTAQLLAARFGTLDRLMAASPEELRTTEEVGEVVAGSVAAFFAEEANRALVERLRAAGLRLDEPEVAAAAAGVRRRGVLPGQDLRPDRDAGEPDPGGGGGKDPRPGRHRHQLGQQEDPLSSWSAPTPAPSWPRRNPSASPS